MTTTHAVTNFLRSLASRYAAPRAGYTYSSTVDLLLDRAEFDGVHAEPMTAEQRVFLQRALRGTRAQYKQCFGNAQQLALRNDRFTYREGYAQGSFFPMHHAWVLLDNKHVVDVTWRVKTRGGRAVRVRGVVPEGWAYFGFTPNGAKDREALRERLIRLRMWASYLDNDLYDFEMLELYKLPRLKELCEA